MHKHYINKLLDLKDEDIIIKDITIDKGIKYIKLELPIREHVCPHCGCLTKRVHDYRTRKIKHQYELGYKVILLYRRRRYLCKDCHKRFPEDNQFVRKYHKISNYTKQLIIKEYGFKQSITDVGRHLNISFHTVMRHIKTHFRPRRQVLPEVLSIDEFKNLSHGYGKYAFLMTDPVNKKLIDVFPNRRKNNLEYYLTHIDKEERDKVKYVISDLWDPYRQLVHKYFPKAKLIADKYHFIRQMYWAVQDVRLRVMKKYKKGTYEYHYLKKYWKNILAYTYNLSINHFKDYKLGYHITAREVIDKVRSFDNDMRKAIDLKDSFYEMMHTTSYLEARNVLESFIDDLYQSKLPEFKIVARTYKNWKEEIINSFITYDKRQLTNGFIEGLNNKIKVIKRIAFGYRNFDHFRLRIFALTYNDCPITSL